MEIFILNDKFEVLAEIDSYTSLIWCRRAHDIGALDLEIEASTENVKRFQIGYFIYRKDTNDICRIDAIEVKTDPENGDSLVIGATDLKSLAEQVSVLGEYKTEITQSGESTIVVANNVKVEEWIREAMKVFTPYDSTVLPKSIYSKFAIDNFSLYDLKGYEDMCILAEDKDLKLSEHINYLCKMSGMRWDITYDYDNKKLKLNLVKGLDKTINQEENTRVLFSQTFDNLQSTKLSQAIDKMANVAAVYHNNASIVGDNGVIFSYLTREEPYGLYRFELPVDGTKVEIPHIQTSADFIQVEAGTGDYKLNDDGTFTKGKGDYNYKPQYTIDEIKSYAEILKGLGLTKLRESRVTQKFESEINFNQFVYREDYDVADRVTVQNEYGIQLDAKIVEIVETWNETGYSIEPIFEFIGTGGNFGGFAGFGNFENTENDWDLTDCLITEDGYPMMTETENYYLMYEDAYSVNMLSTEAGIALTNENGVILEPTSLTRSFAMTRSSGSEPVATALYDVSSTAPIDIETIKISELPEAEDIGDACCLPIVQDGETKKIYFDKIKENIGIEDAVENKANYHFTTMVDLGFTTASIVPVRDFWNKLYSKFGSNGVIQFNWADNSAAWVGAGSNIVSLNGGTLVYTAKAPSTWCDFSALFYSAIDANIYKIRCYYGNNASDGQESWDIIKLANANSVINKDFSNVSAKEVEYNLLKDISEITTAISDDTQIVQRYSAPDSSKGVLLYRKASLLWNYIKNKISTVLNLTSTNYGGTAAAATVAINDLDGNAIKSTYAKKSDILPKKNGSMTGWGFTAGSTISIHQLWIALHYYVGEAGFVRIPWSNDKAAYVTDGKNKIWVSGGYLEFKAGDPNSTWTDFTCAYYPITGSPYLIAGTISGTAGSVTGSISQFVGDDAVKKSSTNTMTAGSSIDFNTNKATLQLPVYSADATDQPTTQGAMWLQEVKESE